MHQRSHGERSVPGEHEAVPVEPRKISDEDVTVTLSQDPAGEILARGEPIGGVAAGQRDLEAADPPHLRGAKVGRYLLLDVLGRGGMGVVYAAYDPELDRKVAIKLVRAASAAPGAQARLLREAQAMARLSSPNVIAVHDVGTYGDRVFLAMELVEGGTLREWMRGQPPVRGVLKTFEQAGRGLAAAHSAGLIHRDFKPDNVLVGKDGRVRVNDFGLARSAAAVDPQAAPELTPEQQLLDQPLTATGTLAGTPGYMAPEQLEGRPADARTDQFSFCVALYEALHGKRPFAGSSSRDLIEAIRSGRLEQSNVASVPAWLRAILVQGLAADPAQRFASMDDLLAALSRDPPVSGRGAARWWWAGLLILLTAALGSGLARHFLSRSAGPDTPATPSIAVLPFTDMSPGKDQEYFADGIAEEILNALAKVPGLRVAGRTSSFYFKGKQEELPTIAARLRVATLLEGSVRKAGNSMRITAQLINAADGHHIWSKEYDRELTDLFKVEGEVATAVVEALKGKLLPGTSLSLLHPARNPEAYRMFLVGRALLLSQTEGSERRSEEALEKSVALEPAYGLAWDYLAAARGNKALTSPSAEVFARARSSLDAAEKAIAIDPTDALAFAMRAWMRGLVLWDWTGAKSDLGRATELGSDDAAVQHMRATVLPKLGHLKEAIDCLRNAVKTDPLNVYSWTNLGSLLKDDGEYAAARDAIRRSLEISPENLNSSGDLADLDLLEGHAEEALAGYQKLRRHDERLTGIALAQYGLHHEAESNTALRALEALDGGAHRFQVAKVHAWRGERDAAFEWLERGVVQHDIELRFVSVDSFLRGIRDDPRYTALLKKMNLPLD